MPASALSLSTWHRLFICLFLLTGLLAAGAGALPTSAQQPDSVEVDTIGPEAPTQSRPSVKRKSPVRAVLYSMGGTIVLTPLFGPAVGHFYADDDAQAWRGIAIRAGGYGLAGGFLLLHGAQVDGWGATAARVTNVVMAIQVWYDIITAWHSAKDYNEAHNIRAQVAPTVGPRGEQVGLALRIQL